MATALSCVQAAQRAIKEVGPLAGIPYSRAVHAARVKTCYRIALKTAVSHYGPFHTTEFWESMQIVDDIRYLFERNNHVTDLAKVDALIDKVYQTIADDATLASSIRYLPPMDPGGTSWQRNIPLPLEVVNAHEETETEILDSWDRYEMMQERWKAEDAQLSLHGDVLFPDENWQEIFPQVRELLSKELTQLEQDLQQPILNRFQAMEQNIRLQIHVHEAIPKSEILQVEIGNGPLPFVQYSRALRNLRNLAEARQKDQSSPAGEWDASAIFRSLPEPEIHLKAMLEGQMETPEETGKWKDVNVIQLLGGLEAFSGAVEQEALRDLHLRHLEPDQVDDWVFQSTRLHILLSALRSPFDELHQEFQNARDPETVRPLEELVEEAKKSRESIMGQSEDFILDGKAAEIRRALGEDRFLRSRIRTRDAITHRGFIPSPYEEYLVLHHTIRYAELVLGRAFLPSFAELPVLTMLEVSRKPLDMTLAEIQATADISPLPLPYTPQTAFAVFLDYVRLTGVAEKLRREHVEIAARHNDPNWLLQREEARVERLRQVREARAKNPLYTELFGSDAPEKALRFHPVAESFLDPVPSALLLENLIVGEPEEIEKEMSLDQILPQNAVRQKIAEGIDFVEANRVVHQRAVGILRQELDAFDMTRQEYEAYKELHSLLIHVRLIRRQTELDHLRMEYPRRDMIEALSRQVSYLHPIDEEVN